MATPNSFDMKRVPPVEHWDVLVVSGRVMKVHTQHVRETVWVATGMVSAPLPTSRWLDIPVEITATGKTEHDAIQALKQRVANLGQTDA